MSFLEGHERNELQTAASIKADIDDWTVTDMGGTHQDIGGSFANSRAALMDSVRSTTPGSDGKDAFNATPLGAMAGHGSSSMAAKGQKLTRYDPELLIKLQMINENRLSENQRNSSVTIEELEDDAPEPDSDAKFQ